MTGGDGDGDVFLNDTWKLFFHDPADADWTMASYVPVGMISSVADYWEFANAVQPHLADGMFFLMREHVFPCWDDKHNIDGGCYSVRVPKERAAGAMADVMMRALGETLLAEGQRARWDVVNGVSISPKSAFNVIKVWMAKASGDGDETVVPPDALRLPAGGRASDVLYSRFRDQIQRAR